VKLILQNGVETVSNVAHTIHAATPPLLNGFPVVCVVSPAAANVLIACPLELTVPWSLLQVLELVFTIDEGGVKEVATS